MKFGIEWIVVAAMIGGVCGGCAHPSTGSASDRDDSAPVPEPLVTGRSIEPRPDAIQNVGSFPSNMIASPDGRYAISTDQGQREALWLIRMNGTGVSHLRFPTEGNPHNSLYYGLAFGPDGTLYAAQGGNDTILVVKIDSDGTLQRQGVIRTRRGDFPSGLATDSRGMLYVADNDNRLVTTQPFELPGSVAIYDTASRREVGRFEFRDSFGGTPNFPLAVAALSDGSRLYVASQRDAAVYVLDVSDAAHPRLIASLPTGAHPDSLLLNRDQSRLFVANAQSDTVSVVDTKRDAIVATVLLRPEIAKNVTGATPTGLALSHDEKTLYVTLGDMNAVAVVDVDDAELLGYIPGGWYPTAAVASPDGRTLLIADAKGTIARTPNPSTRPGARHRSPLDVLEGNVISVAVPSRAELRAQTERVLELDRLTPRRMRLDNPLRSIGLQAGGIRHVIYIVKENRSYDQELGDMTRGNGDPARCIFGRKVTPNQHALADRFVLLDNFYDCGEVSGDGWTWSTQAQENEYSIRNVPYSYTRHNRDYDYEGQVDRMPAGGFPATGPDGRRLSDDPKYRNGAAPVPDVAEAPGGHIWDMARRRGLTYRNYGFFYSDGVYSGKKTIIPDNYPNSAGLQPAGRDLSGISDIDFRRFDLDYPDSEAPLRLAERTHDRAFLRPKHGYGSHSEPSRFSEWHREFKEMLAKAPDGSAVPNFMTIRLPCDHTMGTNPNHHSPSSMVADNDYAVGQLVDAVSHSPIWKSTAIFVVEDDAQNGPDHVDTHRSVCYVASPWIRAGSVDHSFQNTVSLLRTMELILGLPPMCQYDATADPILDWDTRPSNDAPFDAIEPDPEILRQINGANSPKSPISPEQQAMMDESSRMDFAHADRAPADRLNVILWKSVKGYDSVMPPTPHGPSPLVPRGPKKDDDDD